MTEESALGGPEPQGHGLLPIPEGLSFEVALITLSQHAEPCWALAPAPRQECSMSVKWL